MFFILIDNLSKYLLIFNFFLIFFGIFECVWVIGYVINVLILFKFFVNFIIFILLSIFFINDLFLILNDNVVLNLVVCFLFNLYLLKFFNFI